MISSLTGLTFIFTSCNPKLTQKAYFVNSPNVNCFDSPKEKNINVEGSLHQIGIQSNIALDSTYGISSSLFAANGPPWSYGAEIAGIFYKDLTKRHYVEGDLGCGYFKIQSEIYRNDLSTMLGLSGNKYYQNNFSTYYSIYAQPSYFYKMDWLSLGISLKLNVVYFSNYYYYDSETETDERGTFINSTEAYFHKKIAFVCEPVLTAKFRKGFYFQLVWAKANNIFNSPITGTYEGWHSSSSYSVSEKIKNPQLAPWIINIGVNIKLNGKRK